MTARDLFRSKGILPIECSGHHMPTGITSVAHTGFIKIPLFQLGIICPRFRLDGHREDHWDPKLIGNPLNMSDELRCVQSSPRMLIRLVSIHPIVFAHDYGSLGDTRT